MNSSRKMTSFWICELNSSLKMTSFCLRAYKLRMSLLKQNELVLQDKLSSSFNLGYKICTIKSDRGINYSMFLQLLHCHLSISAFFFFHFTSCKKLLLLFEMQRFSRHSKSRIFEACKGIYLQEME